MADDPVERIKKEVDKKVQIFLLWKQLTFQQNPVIVATNKSTSVRDWVGCGIQIPLRVWEATAPPQKEPTQPHQKQEVVSLKEYNGLDTID